MHSSSVLGLDKMMEERINGGDLTNNIVHMDVPFRKPIEEEVYEGAHNSPVLGWSSARMVQCLDQLFCDWYDSVPTERRGRRMLSSSSGKRLRLCVSLTTPTL
mmetsp:Transcript_18356/g.27531  ORF Transcript_18356/g.27531 Transcript_18356/m.27531 type:complete len:103 (+) Transcript_18356:90-398(+)